MSETQHPDTEPRSSSERESGQASARFGRKLQRKSRIGAGAAVALAALVGLVVWLVVDSSGNSKQQARSTAALVSVSGLKKIANALHHQVYWVGKQPGTTIELSQLPNGRIFVRYLPPGTKAGDKGTFLTVGTYPMRNALSVLQAGTKQQGAVPIAVGSGGVALYHRNSHSVYVAYPDSDYQIEVYSPNAASARQLVAANRVRSVTSAGQGTSGTGPVAASIAQLKALSANLGHPIYWAGSQPNVTYELTRTSNGRIYIRYLPAGTPVGAHAYYLTVGTYPVPNAFSVTRRAGKAQGAATLPDGAVAIYKQHGSTHVYLAYPGSDQQIEVFDPTPDKARRLVAAERISPVR